MDIIERIKKGEEVSIEDFLNFDENIIDESFHDGGNYKFYEILFNYCMANKTAENSKIMYLLGYMYYLGKGVEQNYNKAIKYYKRSAEMGNSYALNCLGTMYCLGIGVERNYEESIKYYKKSAEMGNRYAMSNLGHAYIMGEGVEKNFEEAIKYYIMAIENGNEFAMDNLEYVVCDINESEQTIAEKIKYYRLLDQCDKTKKYAQKIVIQPKACDIVRMCDIIERMSQRLEELETHVRYMPDGIGYQDAKMEFESLC
jgi:hypothetical protein